MKELILISVSLFYLFLTNILISFNIEALWRKVVLVNSIRKNKEGLRSNWHPFLLGIVESIIYFSALYYSGRESVINDGVKVIFAWLALKTIARVGYWNKSRTLFNFFLIGNGMSITASFLAFLISRHLFCYLYETLFLCLSYLIFLSVVLVVSNFTKQIKIYGLVEKDLS